VYEQSAAKAEVSMQERAGVADSDEIVDGVMSLSEPIMAIPSYFSRLGARSTSLSALVKFYRPRMAHAY